MKRRKSVLMRNDLKISPWMKSLVYIMSQLLRFMGDKMDGSFRFMMKLLRILLGQLDSLIRIS